MAYTLNFVADFGASRTGMTLNAQLYDADGTPNGAAITTGFVEVDSTNAPGVYSYQHTALPQDHRGTFAIYQASDQTVRVGFSINPEEAEYTDVAVSTLATSAALTTVDGNVDAILVDTDTTIPGLIAALNDLAQSDILSDATPFAGANIAEITAARLAELDAANMPADIDAILADTGTDGVVVATASKTGYALSAAGIQAIWDALTSALTTAGSIGKFIVDKLTLITSGTSVTVSNPVVAAGNAITVYRGTTWIITITGIGDISTYDTVYLSVKKRPNQADDDALLRVYNNASGLLRFNGAAPVAAGNGAIVVDDASAGDITVTINEAETVSAPADTDYSYDIKGIDDDGNVVLLVLGVDLFTVTSDVTRAIVSPS